MLYLFNALVHCLEKLSSILIALVHCLEKLSSILIALVHCLDKLSSILIAHVHCLEKLSSILIALGNTSSLHLGDQRPTNNCHHLSQLPAVTGPEAYKQLKPPLAAASCHRTRGLQTIAATSRSCQLLQDQRPTNNCRHLKQLAAVLKLKELFPGHI